MKPICDLIKENKQLHLDEKICCGDDDCLNVQTKCFEPDSLVACHEMSRIDACERRHRKNLNYENNNGVKALCIKENSDKHLCISADSVDDPNRNAEFNWVVNRPSVNGLSNTELESSCDVCVCCKGNKCSRIFGPDTSCDAGCPIHNLTMLNQKCLLIFEEGPIESIKVGECSDMFTKGSCQFYNLSTGSPLNETINFNPTVCDFTEPPPLDYGDKIALGTGVGLGAPGFILTVITAYLTWRQYKLGKNQYKLEEKRKKELEMRNSHSEMGLNNLQSQDQENQSLIDNVEAESQADNSNNSHIQLLPEQNEQINEEDEVQEP
ncbi:uncharacterized protein OCT59_004528 [Rhizophagus irregularis]|uniref:Uncharacterized protein n=4 Tax=Rhizophagus irregularis TaxID=588596 RepID=A0A015MS07_RHIIW|nr:hypothetical protein RirG_095210 [Rhizophagus irregularis DAOM 197198w]UZO13022.1 hypothetical protein OCT59_004528 [Rhizophagus irregularis]GBC54368.1 hypothetical protein GLOIN_2v1604591 [Rhizophagus irregularis DAOM 181602=DAOM 197198]